MLHPLPDHSLHTGAVFRVSLDLLPGHPGNIAPCFFGSGVLPGLLRPVCRRKLLLQLCVPGDGTFLARGGSFCALAFGAVGKQLQKLPVVFVMHSHSFLPRVVRRFPI